MCDCYFLGDEVVTLLTDESEEEEINDSISMEPMYDWGKETVKVNGAV